MVAITPDSPIGAVFGNHHKKRKLAEEGLGLRTVGDLLRHFPRRYVAASELSEVATPVVGEQLTIVGEVRNSLDYFQASSSAPSVQSLTLVGRTAELEGLMERLSTQIPVPVRRMDPLAGLAASRSVAKDGVPDTRLAVAVGLAMRTAS